MPQSQVVKSKFAHVIDASDTLIVRRFVQIASGKLAPASIRGDPKFRRNEIQPWLTSLAELAKVSRIENPPPTAIPNFEHVKFDTP